MQKNRRLLIASALPLLATTGAAWAQFGGLLGGSKSSGGGNVDADVKRFLDTSFSIEMTASKAYLAIAAAYASEEKRAEYQAQLSDVGKQTNPQEAGAKFQAVRESTEAAIKRISEEKDLAEKTKNLSEDKKKSLARGVLNLGIAALQAKDLVPSGQSIMSGVGTNPMNITKVVPVKDAVPRLQSAITIGTMALPKLIQALKGANISVTPASATSKPESIDAI